MLQPRVADPVRVDPDPAPKLEKNTGTGYDLHEKPDPAPKLEKKSDLTAKFVQKNLLRLQTRVKHQIWLRNSRKKHLSGSATR